MRRGNDSSFLIATGIYVLMGMLADLVLVVYLLERGRLYPIKWLLVLVLVLLASGCGVVIKSLVRRKKSFSVIEIIISLCAFFVFVLYAVECGLLLYLGW